MSDETETQAETAVVETPSPSAARKFKVRNFVETEKLRVDLSFSIVDLSSAMMEQASLYAHYAVLAAKASKQVDDLKLILESTESAVYRSIRDRKVVAGEKITEAQLEKAVAVHPRIIPLKKALNEAKQIEAVAKGAVEGLKQRKDMLVSQGLMSREEMRGEVSINRRNAADSELEAKQERVMAKLRGEG